MKEKGSVIGAALRYTAIAMALPGSALGGYFIGSWIDHGLGTGYWKIVCLILGIVGGFVQLIRELVKNQR